MKKALLLTVVSLLLTVNTVGASSDYAHGSYGEGALYTISNGAYAETIAYDEMNTIEAAVTVYFWDGPTQRTATNSGYRSNDDYVDAGVTVSGTPIEARGTHFYVHGPTNSSSGSTKVTY